MKAYITTAYFPPVQWMALMASSDETVIEAAENYVKQSYRNRCRIATANGVMDLSVPTLHSGSHQSIKDVEADYSTPWQHLHFKALESAYRRSPYYEFYIDDLMWVFNTKEKYLFDLNMKIAGTLAELLGISFNPILTSSFETGYTDGIDARYLIHPKTAKSSTLPGYSVKPYTQVFMDKFGFLPDLSVLDLLFNEGPDSIQYLKF